MARTSSSSSSTAALPPKREQGDLEQPKTIPSDKISKSRMVFDQSAITAEVLHHPYKGNGTEEEPYVVEWLPNDPRNPMMWRSGYKWFITFVNGISLLAIAFVSSGYVGGIPQIVEEFHVSTEVATLGVSLFVLGFAIGPLFWAPLSEVYGRQVLFAITYCFLTAFTAAVAGAQNMWTILILRFLAAAFGCSPVANAGGVIADMFGPAERGLAMTLFAVAPFMGPVLGPVVGNFVGVTIGWRWLQGIMAIFTGVLWIFQSLTVPETYGPVLLRTRADVLAKRTGKHYISVLDKAKGRPKVLENIKGALLRPWVLLFLEPIVLLISAYMSLIYGTVYLMFGAVPIVFQSHRHWPQQIASLAFVAIAIGIILGALYNIYDNKRYLKTLQKHMSSGIGVPAEARLPPAMLGSILLPISLFWFAWSSQPSIHWIVPMLGLSIFGFSIILIFMAGMLYLIDSYVIYAASVLAANAVLRSVFGTVFPLFTEAMYDHLGINWASSLLGFLALAFLPFPWLFYRFGAGIRMKCKFAAQAARVLEQMRESQRLAVMKKKAEEEEKKTVSEQDGEVKEKAVSEGNDLEKGEVHKT